MSRAGRTPGHASKSDWRLNDSKAIDPGRDSASVPVLNMQDQWRSIGSSDVLALQCTIGNRATIRLHQINLAQGRRGSIQAKFDPQHDISVNLEHTIQRDGTARRSNGRRQRGKSLEARASAVFKAAKNHHAQSVGGIANAVWYIDRSVINLNGICDKYEKIYNNVKVMIRRGEGEIEEKKAFVSAVIGIAIGTGVGLAMGAVIKLGKNADKFAKSLHEIGGEVAEWGVAKGVDAATVNSSGGGGEKVMEKANPLLKRLKIYQKAYAAMRELAKLSVRLGELNQVTAWSGQTMAECRELAVSGRNRKFTADELEGWVEHLEKAGARAAEVEAEMTKLVEKAYEGAIASQHAAENLDRLRMERHLWLKWMSRLSGDEIDVLDAPSVSNRLIEIRIESYRKRSGSSKIGWNTGDYQSGRDREKGVRLARGHAAALDRINSIGKITEIVSGSSYEDRSVYARIYFKGLPWYYRHWNVIVDESVDVGDEIRITHIIGGNEWPTLYGRPVNTEKTEAYFEKAERWRRNQLM